MNTLKIDQRFRCEATMVPNAFLDEYMPRANGEFVKVYLYLMRLAGDPAYPATLGSIADRLNYTEQDVLRALRYWASEDLLTLSFDESGAVSGISLNASCAGAPAQTAENAPSQQSGLMPASKTAASYPSSSSERRISPDRVLALQENEDVKELLFIAARYLQKMLSPTEMQKLLYFYEELHFTSDLIEYLIEYCVSKGHPNIRYIEKVGLAWFDEGIRTVKDARQSVSSYHKDYYDILKAIGQGGRHPIEAEIALMKKWIEDYRFPMEIIEEACTRTVMNTKQPSLRYCDGILTSWHNSGVTALGQIAELDAAHAESKKEKKKSSAGNRFTRFEQRDYDYDALESELIGM